LAFAYQYRREVEFEGTMKHVGERVTKPHSVIRWLEEDDVNSSVSTRYRRHVRVRTFHRNDIVATSETPQVTKQFMSRCGIQVHARGGFNSSFMKEMLKLLDSVLH
jgi:hypothetical protein